MEQQIHGMGGFMKINGFGVSRGVILGASLLAALPWWSAAGQTPDAQAASTTATQTPLVPARVTQTVDEGNRFTLRGNVHPMARAEFDRGAVADSEPATRMSLLLQRSPDQESDLRQLLEQQQDKTSPNYHKWLTPDQFGKQYGPADADIQAATDWLTSRGFSGIKVSPGRTRIEFSGNVGQVRNAFQTEIHHFFVNGKTHVANVSDPQIPAALAPVVSGVVSLHDFRPRSQAHRLGTFRKTKATGEVKPLFTFAGCGSGGTQPCYAVGPGDFSKIYNLPAGTPDGTGVTIAIVQDSNLNVADVTQFRSLFGLPANFSTSNIILNGPDPGIQGPDSFSGDEVEADLDVQWAGAVAPGATIDLVVSEDSQTLGDFGIDLSAFYIVDNNIAPILSESFGSCEAGLMTAGEQQYVALWQQAAAQGITVILSAGDSGSAACDPSSTATNQDIATQGLAVSGLASTAYNVALGGTDFLNGASPSVFWNPPSSATTSAKSYIPESTWNDSCASTASTGNLGPCTATVISKDDNVNADTFGVDLVAGGGGASSFTTLNPKPLWQTGTSGNPADGVRDVPDISLFSGNGFNGSFYIICEEDANTGTGSSVSSCDLNASSDFNDFQGVGGTSAAAPAFAGIMARVIQQQAGARQGNANFVLYQLYKNNPAKVCTSNAAAVTASGCIFYDTVTGNNSVACQGGTTNCSNTGTAANQYGVLVDPAHLGNPAWMTKTGYDLATGLGSLNVTNLLAAWSSATFTADTVTITSTNPASINITHGSSVTFNVSVSPAPPNASGGTVSLVATPTSGTPPTTGSQLGIGAFSQNTPTTTTNGSVSIATNLLPGGTAYPVVASYSGDGVLAAGTSSPVMVTVMPEGSQTAVSVWTFDSSGNVISKNATSVAYGSPYVLLVAVSDSGGHQCESTVVACPTGTITLTDSGGALKDFSGSGTTKLNSLGYAEDQPVQLGGGTHSLVAVYSGDNSYTTSTSTADAVTVTKATTTSTVTSSVTTIPVGQTVTLTATIATGSSGVGPTGTVTFKSGTTTLGSASVTGTAGVLTGAGASANGTASTTVTFSAAGAQSVVAVYSGDSNYAASTSPATTVTATAGTQVTTTVVTSSVTTVASGGSVTLTAKVTGTANNAAGPTGTLQFMNGAAALGTPATCAPTAGTSTTPGTCTATLMTTLALSTPSPVPANRLPNRPGGVSAPIWIVAGLLLAAFLLGVGRLRGAPAARRLGYACAGVLLFAGLVAGIAGCGGSGGGGGGNTPHTDSITAVYGGDGTYAGSTSAAVSVSVQ
jgi:Pro-kumamolisin, activation domain/Bacterial Ig-like domain (group 3)